MATDLHTGQRYLRLGGFATPSHTYTEGMTLLPEIPSRRGARRRDRHGRGLRGPLIAPTLPAWRTRREEFDDLVAESAARLVRSNLSLRTVEFGVEEIPPSDPSAWEGPTVVVGRYFPADRASGVAARIVVYRRPLLSRAHDADDLEDLVRMVLAEQAAEMLGLHPWDVDPRYPDH